MKKADLDCNKKSFYSKNKYIAKIEKKTSIFQTIQLQKHDNDRLKTKLRWNEEENVKKDKIISQLVEEALVSDVSGDSSYQ